MAETSSLWEWVFSLYLATSDARHGLLRDMRKALDEMSVVSRKRCTRWLFSGSDIEAGTASADPVEVAASSNDAIQSMLECFVEERSKSGKPKREVIVGLAEANNLWASREACFDAACRIMGEYDRAISPALVAGVCAICEYDPRWDDGTTARIDNLSVNESVVIALKGLESRYADVLPVTLLKVVGDG